MILIAFFFGRNINNNRNRNTSNNTINNTSNNRVNNPTNNNQFHQNINNNNLNNNNLISSINNIPPTNNSDINQGVNFQPLTEEDLLKINEEIQENIKHSKLYLENKNSNINNNFNNNINNNFNNNLVTRPTSNPNSPIIISYLHDFIQSEKNSHDFYKNLANTCSIKHYKQKFTEISNDCLIEQKNLVAYLEDFHKENSLNISSEIFKPLDIDIFPISNLRDGVMLAVEEEIKYYDKLSKIVEDLPPKDTRIFYAMALRKLGRINNVQYVFLRL
ncbi:MAG: hypothetical protein R3Y29_02350 [bacterium]